MTIDIVVIAERRAVLGKIRKGGIHGAADDINDAAVRGLEQWPEQTRILFILRFYGASRPFP